MKTKEPKLNIGGPLQALDDINTNEGCVERLLLAEILGPKSGSYDLDTAKIVAVAMIAVLQNRLNFKKPYIFCAPKGSTMLKQFATAVCKTGGAQFKGFSMDGDGNVIIADDQLGVINDIIGLANGGDQACIDHINMIIGYANSTVADPYYNTIPAAIDGEDVYPNVYGWRTAGSGTGGDTYKIIPIRNNPSGVLLGTQFLAMVKSVG